MGRIWLLPLETAATAADGIDGDWLTADEACRLQSMTSPMRRRSFLGGHWGARELAGEWLQTDPRRIALDRHVDGRPRLQVDGEPVPLSLSLSHSGDWLAIALATGPVGIDVEVPRRARDLDALARFVFSPEEVKRLLELPEPARGQTFHVTWTLKEARGKRLGEGLLPSRSRLVTASPSEAGTADAMSWPLADGALAIAIEPGSELVLQGMDALGLPAYWRYHAAGETKPWPITRNVDG